MLFKFWLFCRVQNNCGLTAAQVAYSCGHTECAQYIEIASSKQHSVPQQNVIIIHLFCKYQGSAFGWRIWPLKIAFGVQKYFWWQKYFFILLWEVTPYKITNETVAKSFIGNFQRQSQWRCRRNNYLFIFLLIL